MTILRGLGWAIALWALAQPVLAATTYRLAHPALLSGLATPSAQPRLVVPASDPLPNWVAWLLSLTVSRPLTLAPQHLEGDWPDNRGHWLTEMDLGLRGRAELGFGPSLRLGGGWDFAGWRTRAEALGIWTPTGTALALDAQLSVGRWSLEAHRFQAAANSPAGWVRLSWRRSW